MFLNLRDFNYVSNSGNEGKDFPILKLTTGDSEVMTPSQNKGSILSPAFKVDVANTNGGAGDEVVSVNDILDVENPKIRAIQNDGEELEVSYNRSSKEVTISFTTAENGVLYYQAGKGVMKLIARTPSMEGGIETVLYSSGFSMAQIDKEIKMNSKLILNKFDVILYVNSEKEVEFEKLGSVSLNFEVDTLQEVMGQTGLSYDELLNTVKIDYSGIK